MLDEDNCVYITKNDYIKLTPMETYLLGILIKHKNGIVTREYLIKNGFKGTHKTYMSSIICRLRKKLKGEVKIITRQKAGYFIL